MAVFGHLDPFDEERESFVDYVDRCNAFMAANAITDGVQKANLFIAVIGPEPYKLLKNLCQPEKPAGKSYEVLVKLLQDHYEPSPIIIAERHKFWSANQESMETVSAFVVRLKLLASTCEFGSFLEEALRDRLVSGLHQKMARTQRHLLTDRNLTFKTAKEKCIADEMAGQATKDHWGTSELEVNTTQMYENATAQRSRVSGRPSGSYGTGDSPNRFDCKCCGGRHRWENCKFKEAVCFKCRKKGHIKTVCYAKGYAHVGGSHGNRRAVHSLEPELKPNLSNKGSSVSEEEVESQEIAEAFGIYKLVENNTQIPYKIDVNIDGKSVAMELDTGAARSTVSELIYNKVLSHFPLHKSNVVLHSYAKTVVPVLGVIHVPVSYGEQAVCLLELIVVKGDRPALFGRDWLCKFKINWAEVFLVKEGVPNGSVLLPTSDHYPKDFRELLVQYSELFSLQGTGIKHFRACIQSKPDVRPVYQKSRPVPYALLEGVEKEYDRLIQSGVLYPVTNSSWASPAVHVPKGQGSIRICGDYKAVNEAILDDGYKLPNIQDLMAKIAGNGKQPKVYSVIDLAGAFNQLILDQDSAKLLVLNTCKGLLATTRLCFGIKTAPAQFQATMDKILTGIDNVYCYIDDILIATETVEQHVKTLSLIFQRFAKYNVKMNGKKCQFFRRQVNYLGHSLHEDGISPLSCKVKGVQEAPRPTNVSELKSFLGMVNFYGRFIPNLASELHPLYKLLNHCSVWHWNAECQSAFQWAKKSLTGDLVLTHYDSGKPLVLSVDASPYGLGAVLSHRMMDGSERPVAYASRTLSSAEKNYAQIEKEGLAIIFGVKKFHLYLFGRKFTLVTDHQPLTRIFGPKYGIPPLAAARMQRWALVLSGYDYKIAYRPSAANANADMLSRLPVKQRVEVDPDEVYLINSVVDSLPITAGVIARVTDKDYTLCRVMEFTLSGWPVSEVDPSLIPYRNKRFEISVEDGCLLWGRRVIIPDALKDNIMKELHECHPGVCRMKALARSFVWWPSIDRDIEDLVRQCEVCLNCHVTPKQVPLILWPWSTEPWQRVHVDFLEIRGQQFLIFVDSHSKWMEVSPMASTSAAATINVCKGLFARYGFPREIVSDNGPQFVSQEFKSFLKVGAVKHTLCPPYHPASNGLAERYVQTFKKLFTKHEGSQLLHHKLPEILFHYRNTPHSVTGKTPAELFLKRTPRTKLSLLKPSLKGEVELKQSKAKCQRDGSHPVMRSYDLYQRVRVKNCRGGKEKWIPGTIVKIKGPLTYIVRLPGNIHRFVHADHIIADDSESAREAVGGSVRPHSDIGVSGYPGDQYVDSDLSKGVDVTEGNGLPIPNGVSGVEGNGLPVPNGVSGVFSPETPGKQSFQAGTTDGETTPGRVSRYGRIIKAPSRLDL